MKPLTPAEEGMVEAYRQWKADDPEAFAEAKAELDEWRRQADLAAIRQWRFRARRKAPRLGLHTAETHLVYEHEQRLKQLKKQLEAMTYDQLANIEHFLHAATSKRDD